MSASFHVSNFGSFGGSLPRDLDGYCHLTAAAWIAAPMDFGSEDMDDEAMQEWAEEIAAESRQAVKDAEAKLAEWRSVNA